MTIMFVPDSAARIRRLHTPYWTFSMLIVPIICIMALVMLNHINSGNLERQLLETTTQLSDTLRERDNLAAALNTATAQIVDYQADYGQANETQAQAEMIKTLESIQKAEENAQRLNELLAKVDTIDNMSSAIIGVFKDLDALDIPFKFDEATLSGGVMEAAGGAYTGELEDFLDELDVVLTEDLNEMQSLTEIAGEADSLFKARPSVWPVSSTKTGTGYGYRANPFTNAGTEWHDGIDIDVPYGTEVYATAYGVVAFAGWNTGGYGYLVVIEHGYDYSTYYAHNSEVLVNAGDEVVRGQLIALTGNTGRSTSAHLHYEVRLDNLPQNPMIYLPELIDNTTDLEGN